MLENKPWHAVRPGAQAAPTAAPARARACPRVPALIGVKKIARLLLGISQRRNFSGCILVSSAPAIEHTTAPGNGHGHHRFESCVA